MKTGMKTFVTNCTFANGYFAWHYCQIPVPYILVNIYSSLNHYLFIYLLRVTTLWHIKMTRNDMSRERTIKKT